MLKIVRYIFAIVLLCIGLVVPFRSTFASTGAEYANWLSNETPHVSRVQDLPADQEPVSLGYDCTPTDFPTGLKNNGDIRHGCVFANSLGSITADYLLDGPSGTLQFDYSKSGFFLPSPPGRTNTIVSYVIPSSGTGDIVRMSQFDGTPAKHVTYWGLPMIEQYVYSPVNPVNLGDGQGNYLGLAPDTIAYSQNGDWMAAYAVNKGIVLYDMTTLTPKLIAWDTSSRFSGAEYHSQNLAVSNDGRFVATNAADRDNNTMLRVYDTTTCKNQLPSGGTNPDNCEYKDIWNGTYRNRSSGTPLKDLVNIEYPRHIRFVGDNLLQFDGVHDRTSPQHFQVSRYVAIVSEQTHEPYISLLGMGDSYIAGEGTFQYLYGTDTSNDKCHNSWLSYPVATGKKYYPQVRSVACSGAKINDIDAGVEANQANISNLRKLYSGQTRDRISWKDRDNQSAILGTFMPGYANQILFTDKYHPRATLLSIGGNDVHFADIVAQCVSPLHTNTCYATYEDRYELMQNIVGQYDRLVALYKDVAASSGGSVYVIGYPQIANPAGKCRPNVLMNSDELRFGSDLITYIDYVISRAAASAGVYYVNTADALNGYRLCEAPKDQAAMNGFTTGNDNGITIGGKKIYFLGNESYHPTAFGYKLLGDTIALNTRNFTAPMPNPTNWAAPAISPNSPLLTGVPKTSRTLNMIIWRDPNFYNPLTTGETLLFDTLKQKLEYGSAYTLTLHSTPYVLSKGKIDGSKATVTIPADVPSGFHTLDLYGTGDQGQPVDIRQVVYIGTTADLQKSCLNMPLSGNDENSNGIDDTCDAGYFDPSLVPYLHDTPPDQPEFNDDSIVATADTEDILTPLPASQPDSTPAPDDTDTKPIIIPTKPTDSKAITTSSSQTLLAFLTPNNASNNIGDNNNSSMDPQKVLGAQSMQKHGKNNTKDSQPNPWGWIILIIIVGAGMGTGVFLKHRRRNSR